MQGRLARRNFLVKHKMTERTSLETAVSFMMPRVIRLFFGSGLGTSTDLNEEYFLQRVPI